MIEREFHLGNREETLCFERLLDEYRQRRGLHPYRHLPLGQAHEALVDHPEGRRLFVSLFDIQLSRAFLDEDLDVITDVLNRDIHERRSSIQSILADPDFFAERVDLHKACTNFVLLYRALWDKIMGVLILLLCSKEYDKFGCARSRLKAFAKIMRETNSLPEEECNKIEKFGFQLMVLWQAMDNADLMQTLINALRDCANRQKYCRKATSADEDNALQAFSLLMENPSLPEDLAIRVLTGEKEE